MITDEILVQRTCRGDETAFLLLYERYRTQIFRFAYRMLGSVELAEDITHDCFLSLIKRPGRFDPSRASLRTYLYAAARNLALKNYRHNNNEVAFDNASDQPHPQCIEGPLQQLIDEELSKEVRKAVAGLPPLQREALTLFEYEELTLAEIAVVVGADVGTIKSRIHRARARLRSALEPHLKSNSGFAILKRYSA